VTEYRLAAEPRADLDVAATFAWYEKEQAGLGQEFLIELRATYDRVADAPLAYQDLRSGIRRVLVRHFPYAVYFVAEGDVVVVLAVPPRNSRSRRMAAPKELITAPSNSPVRVTDMRQAHFLVKTERLISQDGSLRPRRSSRRTASLATLATKSTRSGSTHAIEYSYTIQKFFPEERGDRHPVLSDRRNVVVIADEAHRSQYDFIDGFARHMRDALPNASFIGFTGTPIEKADASTRAVFGEYISV
jgi:plasmid stabilization system protein ParE